jgi:hypothetical protein
MWIPNVFVMLALAPLSERPRLDKRRRETGQQPVSDRAQVERMLTAGFTLVKMRVELPNNVV